MIKLKKSISLILLVLLLLTLLVGCGKKDEVVDTQTEVNGNDVTNEIPEIQFSWGLDLHTALPFIPLNRVEEFKERGIYLNALSDDKYELIEDGKPLAVLSFVSTKGGSEVATMMGQGHLDAALSSNTAILTAIDSGTDIKILCPIQTGGISFVFSPDIHAKGWEEVKEYISNSEAPVMIGYHSPVSGPRILIETILKKEGFKITEDPNQIDADVLMVDLKGQNNLIPSLSSRQVDAWVGPTAYPEIAESKGMGNIAMNLKDFPPTDTWTNFPCCVYSVREEVLNKYPEVFRAFARLLNETCNYAMENKEDAAKIFSDVVGVEKETAEKSTITYTTNPDENWLKGINVYVDGLNEMGKFSGRFKDKSFDEVVEKAFDFSYIKNVRGE